ncbi:hypothetical protein A2Z33_02725 [Candidatus Gottesmanbacteria bacterium RBG_16_52_11]|uniref:Ribonuclease n=1 Tax=Candidatus Gottesmanbacteria bacterium RBG_16_52_11 TaxID=1798374 RepID=A0A1F5YMQ5_9BACT|nr:MAG: hypothetical protein A2Z33_02725 [Candidatus Gottesmanbacteria bacterium RBG_16_52_11]
MTVRHTSIIPEICGLDESGRGALAGPLVGAAVIFAKPLRPGSRIAGVPLRDGKTLSPGQRRRIYEWLLRQGAGIYTETVPVSAINRRGIQHANVRVFMSLMRRIPSQLYFIDGRLKLPHRINGRAVISRPKADTTVSQVILAGIVAKVVRDEIMSGLHLAHPHYGWITNMGYGTDAHVRALLRFGPTSHHRSLFVRTAISKRL